MGKGKTNKRKGSNAERLYAKLFRELGFSFCQTARYGSRLTDDAGIDLINLPYNVQIKAGYHKGMNPGRVLDVIDERLPELFPPEDQIHNKINILIHRNQIGPGKKRVPEDDLVYLKVTDFIKIGENYVRGKGKVVEKKYYYDYVDLVGNKKKGVTYKDILTKQGSTRQAMVIHHNKPASKYKEYNHLAIMSFEYFKQLIRII